METTCPGNANLLLLPRSTIAVILHSHIIIIIIIKVVGQRRRIRRSVDVAVEESMPFGPSEGLFEALQGVQRQSLQYAQVAPEVLALEHLVR